MKRATPFVAALFAALMLSVGHTQQATPPRDARPAALTGTAVLSGVVTPNDPGAPPLRNAQVGILGTENGLIRISSTDEAGRFIFADLPAGRYVLGAMRPPYVDAVYGAKQAGRAGTAIALQEGERRTDIELKMSRGAVITGTVTDEQGLPAVDVNVELIQPGQGASDMQMMRSMIGLPQAKTDDRGAFRFSGLAAGDYIVAVTPSDIGGLDARPVTESDVQAALKLLKEAATAPAAEAKPPATTVISLRGGGVPVQTSLGPLQARGPVAIPNMQAIGYAPIYYPGTTDLAEATTITIASGDERRGIDLIARPVPTTSVEGVALGQDGQPVAGVSVTARLTGRNEVLSLPRMLSIMSAGMGRTQADGRFVLSGLAPGKYTLEARTGSPGALAMLAGRAGGAGGAPTTPQPPQLWASLEFVASGQPLTGQVLRLQPGMTLSGRVAFDATTATPPKDFASVMVGARPIDTGLLGAMSAGAAAVSADGTFTVTGLAPGRYLVTAAVASPTNPADGLTWLGQTIVIDGRDVSDLPIDVRPDEHIKNVAITLTDRQQELSGTLQDPAGRAAPEFTVLLFPADRKYWLPSSRRILTTRPGTDGRFAFRGPLGPPPGEYLLAAVTDLRPDDEYKVAFLDAVAKAALRITLKAGERLEQNLRLVR
jgi:hypothetical protein